jgi:hypothetical protein
VPDDVGARDAELVEHRDHVRDASGDRIFLACLRPFRFAEAAQVGGDDAHPGVEEGRDLVTPAPRGVGKPVEEQHGLPLALVEHGQLDAVACDSAHRRQPKASISTKPPADLHRCSPGATPVMNAGGGAGVALLAPRRG